MPRTLILVRHGETTYNASRRLQGQLDTDLSAVGIRQARGAAERLRTGVGGPAVRLVSSDLRRARDTADILGEALGLEPSYDRRLRETHIGSWQGLAVDEVDAHYPGARARWRFDPRWAPPGGESRLDVARRAQSLIDSLLRDVPEWPGATVVLVAHGGTIAALTARLLGLSPDRYGVFKGLGNLRCAQLTGLSRRPEAYTVGGRAGTVDGRAGGFGKAGERARGADACGVGEETMAGAATLGDGGDVREKCADTRHADADDGAPESQVRWFLDAWNKEVGEHDGRSYRH